jgi:hypothetical protein
MQADAASLHSGTRLERLRGLRDLLAAQLLDTDSGRDVAALSARFMDVLDKIDAAEVASAPVKGTTLDEFSKRRSRRAAAGGGARPAV